MERALFYAMVVAMVNMLGVVVVLNNAPIAVVEGTVVGIVAMLRGVSIWVAAPSRA